MTAWASWQFREFVFHVTRNVNTASREEGNLYTPAVPRALAGGRRQVRKRLFRLTERFSSHAPRPMSPEGRNGQAKPLSGAQSGATSSTRTKKLAPGSPAHGWRELSGKHRV